MKYKTFKKAPITEAILDIKVELPPDFRFESFEDHYNKIKNDFPKKQASIQYQAEFKMKPDQEPTQDVKKWQNGFIFKNNNNSKIAQFRLDGFTFNKIKPYENWGNFSKEAREHWNNYCEIAKPKKIYRIALRYINKINIPGNNPKLKDYITILPSMPKKLSLDYSEFFLRNVFLNKDNIKSIIIETIDTKSEMDNFLPFILDIDVFEVSEEGFEIKNLWKEFDKLREVKNELFFNITTAKCQNLFK
jgi:uncharacterized protein (TIGR04255 family)